MNTLCPSFSYGNHHLLGTEGDRLGNQLILSGCHLVFIVELLSLTKFFLSKTDHLSKT